MDVENYTPPHYPKSQSEIKFLTDALLSNNFIFSSLPTSHSRLLIDAMEMKEYGVGDEIITQGDTGEKGGGHFGVGIVVVCVVPLKR